MKKAMITAVLALVAGAAIAQDASGFPSTHSREPCGIVRYRRGIRIAPYKEKEEQRLRQATQPQHSSNRKCGQ